MTGRLHSIQTLGALDGPGLRTVIILQGCPLQCRFCHSVDTTVESGGKDIESSELVEEVMKNEVYWKSYNGRDGIEGGVTVTGGDPMAQPRFLREILREFKDSGVHTTIETSLYTSPKAIDMVFDHIDLWMIGFKAVDEQMHINLTGKSNKIITQNLNLLDEMISKRDNGSKIRLRYVVVPDLTDDEITIKALGERASKIDNLEKLELLPYVTMGVFKWKELFGEYSLEGTREANEFDMRKVEDILEPYGLDIKSV